MKVGVTGTPIRCALTPGVKFAVAVTRCPMADDLRTFYRLVQRTRAGVLDWLETLPPEVLTTNRDDFAYGNLARIYSHIAFCYLIWLSRGGIGENTSDPQATNISELRQAFALVDQSLERALETFDAWDETFVHTFPNGWEETLSQRWLILHPITHEFHHKGQALALARVLGHPHHGSPDTDLVTPLPPLPGRAPSRD